MNTHLLWKVVVNSCIPVFPKHLYLFYCVKMILNTDGEKIILINYSWWPLPCTIAIGSLQSKLWCTLCIIKAHYDALCISFELLKQIRLKNMKNKKEMKENKPRGLHRSARNYDIVWHRLASRIKIHLCLRSIMTAGTKPSVYQNLLMHKGVNV